MESLLQSLPHVVVYLDDILITGENDEEHLRILAEVLNRMKKSGLRLNRTKCEFMSPSATYLSHCKDKWENPEKRRIIHVLYIIHVSSCHT